MNITNGRSSIVYQITQECPFKCDICHRRYVRTETSLTAAERRLMVDILKQQHVGRITITGGEPMLLGAELFDFLRYVHDKQIHTCLSTTGFRITKAQFEEMDQYLDQMMISIRSLDMKFWKRDFGKTHFAEELLPQVLTLLEWARSTRINFEVCTVVHKENIDSIVDLGWNLLRLNPQIFWRIDEYYGMELNSDMRHRFQLEDSAFDQIHEQIGHLFEGRFKGIRFTTKQQRENSLEYLITYSGELVTSFEHNHNNIGLNLLKSQLPFEFKMLRTWSELGKICRDWGWNCEVGDL